MAVGIELLDRIMLEEFKSKEIVLVSEIDLNCHEHFLSGGGWPPRIALSPRTSILMNFHYHRHQLATSLNDFAFYRAIYLGLLRNFAYV